MRPTGQVQEEGHDPAEMDQVAPMGPRYDPVSAWKSSLKTGKRLRLNWTKTRKDRKKQDWTRLKTGKDHTPIGR